MTRYKTADKSQLIKRFHTLLGVYGITRENKEDILEGYGVESSRDLTTEQLQDVCQFIEDMGNPLANRKANERRKLLSAVCKLMEETTPDHWETMRAEERLDYAKSVACRAAGLKRTGSHGRDNFNALGIERMRSLTYAFNKRRKDMDAVVGMCGKLIKQK